MKKVSKQMLLKETTLLRPSATVGLDLGDRFSHYCLLNAEGEVIEEGRMHTTEAALRRHFGDGPRGTLKPVPFQPESFSAACKAHIDYIAFRPGINSRPTLKPTFSAARKTLTYQPRLIKANPIYPRFHPQRSLNVVGFVSYRSSTGVADPRGIETGLFLIRKPHTRSCLVLRNRKSGYAGGFSSHRVARSRAISQICF